MKTMRRSLLLLSALLLFSGGLACAAPAAADSPLSGRSVTDMLGEKLTYDLSFLWFTRLAEGSIVFLPGPEPGQYRALLEARTLGLTAFLTRHRVEKIETIMELTADGFLRPLLQSAHTIHGTGSSRTERVRSYRFNYRDRTVLYKNTKTGKNSETRIYQMENDGPVYDVLSSFYNVRAGLYGPISGGEHLALPTFTRRGTEDVIIAQVVEAEKQRHPFFPPELKLCKVLVDPDMFGTEGRDIFMGIDENMIPRRMVVKGVVGLGDARGILREVSNTLDDQPHPPLVRKGTP